MHLPPPPPCATVLSAAIFLGCAGGGRGVSTCPALERLPASMTVEGSASWSHARMTTAVEPHSHVHGRRRIGQASSQPEARCPRRWGVCHEGARGRGEGEQADIRMADNRRGSPPLPPSRPKGPSWEKTEFTIGKSDRATFATQTIGSQNSLPPPPSSCEPGDMTRCRRDSQRLGGRDPPHGATETMGQSSGLRGFICVARPDASDCQS